MLMFFLVSPKSYNKNIIIKHEAERSVHMSKLSSTDVIRQALRDKFDREVNKAIYVDEIKKNIIFALFFLLAIIGFVSILRNIFEYAF